MIIFPMYLSIYLSIHYYCCVCGGGGGGGGLHSLHLDFGTCVIATVCAVFRLNRDQPVASVGGNSLRKPPHNPNSKSKV